MDSSPAQSLADVILPGELADFPDPRTNSHIERGRLQGIGHPTDKLPTRTLEIRDSRKTPQKPKRENTDESVHPRQTPAQIRDFITHQPISRPSPETIRDFFSCPQTPYMPNAPSRCGNKKPHTRMGMR